MLIFFIVFCIWLYEVLARRRAAKWAQEHNYAAILEAVHELQRKQEENEE